MGPSAWDEISVLGQGGQAIVHRVRRVGEDDPYYARKRLIDPSRSQRFHREIDTMTRLASEMAGIPDVLDFGVMGKKQLPYYVMPLYAGNLADMVASGLVRSYVERLDVLLEAAAILLTVHDAGVAHRDLKLENILIDADKHPVLADFGLCLDVPHEGEPQDRLTEEWRAVGARLYIAPEMETGLNASSDHRPADFWSFGKIIWCTMTGLGPRSAADQLSSANRLSNVDRRLGVLDALSDQMLIRDPSARLDSWHPVIDALARVRSAFEEESPIPAVSHDKTPFDFEGVRRAALRLHQPADVVRQQEIAREFDLRQAELRMVQEAVNRGAGGQLPQHQQIAALLPKSLELNAGYGSGFRFLTDDQVFDYFAIPTDSPTEDPQHPLRWSSTYDVDLRSMDPSGSGAVGRSLCMRLCYLVQNHHVRFIQVAFVEDLGSVNIVRNGFTRTLPHDILAADDSVTETLEKIGAEFIQDSLQLTASALNQTADGLDPFSFETWT